MKSTKRLATTAVLVSLALILSFVESRIPAFFPIPGIKLGLANIVTLFAIYRLGAMNAVYISLVRVSLASVLFGTFPSFLYAAAGATLSLLVMVLVKKLTPLTTVTVSVLGGVAHNVAQVAVASVILSTNVVIYYLPPLLLSGTVAGVAIGLVGGLLVKKVKI
jgi:heptaprenyl diphosphate synthase